MGTGITGGGAVLIIWIMIGIVSLNIVGSAVLFLFWLIDERKVRKREHGRVRDKEDR